MNISTPLNMPASISSETPTDEAIAIEPVQITREDIIRCRFSSWYGRFRDATFKSRVIPLPKEFIDYLNADGIYLPDEGQAQAARLMEQDSDDEDALDDFDTDGNETEEQSNAPSFPEVEDAIRDAVAEYEGAIFPKLNWSSPRDAAWITATQSLKCTNAFDIYLLLKSSDFINYDLSHAYDECTDGQHYDSDQSYELVLRKWYDLHPSMEFRCFVRNREIIGISQRDINYYEFLADMKDELETTIHEFFEDRVRDQFESDNYVFDVYVLQNRRTVKLVDFNPFSPTTDGLLYEWAELYQISPDDNNADIRIITSQVEANMRARCAPSFSANMVPKDVVDLSNGQTIAQFAEDFHKAMAGQKVEDSSDEDDEPFVQK
ncbi:hypothetical protein K450DRAFT_237687 [Umbelopsis ramanniana AG]|uniref:Cell division cycle protein 123 n=1 Tax=Umbelopsis ramanniana AG TaxID=1314678 RepID=A0AAD5HDG7_UMBRA|nr:uncharacterized protein K450DRAFT_237687 [Umbelopsis ramanniana AG]KAI8580275.1 hypothetical protein K450DRAFT_237687 [Umbelopsis ramanniana AG]